MKNNKDKIKYLNDLLDDELQLLENQQNTQFSNILLK